MPSSIVTFNYEFELNVTLDDGIRRLVVYISDTLPSKFPILIIIYHLQIVREGHILRPANPFLCFFTLPSVSQVF